MPTAGFESQQASGRIPTPKMSWKLGLIYEGDILGKKCIGGGGHLTPLCPKNYAYAAKDVLY